jgi:hypothetical protein
MENDRLDRVERILEEMAVRQQYHDEAFERFDVEMRELKAVIANDAENIQALLRIAVLHDRRLNNLEGPA